MASRIRPSFQVFNLYRRALKELSNNLDRDTLSLEAAKVRKEFEEYKGEVNPDKVRFLIERAHYWIDQVRHSEPYVVPSHPGGVTYLRNPQLDVEFIKHQSQQTEGGGHHHH